MINVLLLEPEYKNKYPPLGLMKIAYYHKEIRHDYVLFSKGPIKKNNQPKFWDRVYIATLFTFEWEATKKTIEYAHTVVKEKSNIYVGGILATLMPDLIKTAFPEINVIVGQLNVKGAIGYDNDECIDNLTPDYSILRDIVDYYRYPTENAYIMYMTRGCGMKCGFCAVQTLEPKYISHLTINEQIKNIDEKFGVKRDLLLMDNNVLISPKFNQIIEEIKELGFAKGSTYINPETKKINKRIVDFNQGLDAFLLTEEKAKKLSELEIVPARIAFDHIEDEDTYRKAISYCAKYGIRELSNYILYNSEAFKGKGKHYKADTPEDLYNRIKISIDIKDEINKDLPDDQKVSIFSFPMRYIPLQDTKRGYVGSNWNEKYLRAVQTIMIPTQGKGVSSRSFFNAAFGETSEEFVEVLAMPEEMIAKRGHFVERKNEEPKDRDKRYAEWLNDIEFRKEWKRLYNSLGSKKDQFLEIICHNDLNVDRNTEKFLNQSDSRMVKLLLHYLNPSKLLKLFSHIDDQFLEIIYMYCVDEFPKYFENLAKYVYSSINKNYAVVANYLRIFGIFGMKELLKCWTADGYSNPNFLEYAYKLQAHVKIEFFNFKLLSTFIYFKELGALTSEQLKKAKSFIVELDDEQLKSLLAAGKSDFINAIEERNSGDICRDILKDQIDMATSTLFKEIGIA